MIFKAKPTERYYEPNSPKPIDGIAATVRGHEITLRFLVARKVVSGGNISLSGSIDMAAKRNDLLCLVFDGEVWHETSRVVK